MRAIGLAALAWLLVAAGPAAGDDGAGDRTAVQVAQTGLPSFGAPRPAPAPPAPNPPVQAGREPDAAEEPSLGPKPPVTERPEWWWTDPLCRPNWRKLGNCRFDRRGSGDRRAGRRLRDPR